MKKIFVFVLSFALLICFAACSGGKEAPVGNDSSAVTQIETSSVTASADTQNEQITSSDVLSSEQSSSSRPQIISKPVSSSSAVSNSPAASSGPAVSSKPSSNSNTNNNSNSTNNNPITTKPTENPYFVKVELLSITRPNSIKVDGMELLDRLYGYGKALQTGDTVKYRIVMSDGGNSGFELFNPGGSVLGGCVVNIDGNILTVTATDTSNAANVVLTVNTQNGSERITVGQFDVIQCEGDDITSESTMYILLRDYGIRLGMTEGVGSEIGEGKNSVLIKIPNNPLWIEQALDAIENWKAIGCSRFSFRIVYVNAFQGNAE